VVHHQVGDHPDPALVRGSEEALEVGQRAVEGRYALEVRDVVAVVTEG